MLDLISAIASSVQLFDRFFKKKNHHQPYEVIIVEINAQRLPSSLLSATHGMELYWHKNGLAPSNGYQPFILETECGERYMYKSRSGILYCK
ncbi:hypothetical protein [Rheinheimera sp.]|uniref:hypothetical protein n=1 Tax=Rheinheimera sp. TaxID=1869214 RepID=UPI003D2B15A1